MFKKINTNNYLDDTMRIRIQKQRAKVVAAAWLGDGIDSIPCRTRDLAPGYMKKGMNRRMYTWQNGLFLEMDDHLVHTKPSHPLPSQNGCSS